MREPFREHGDGATLVRPRGRLLVDRIYVMRSLFTFANDQEDLRSTRVRRYPRRRFASCGVTRTPSRSVFLHATRGVIEGELGFRHHQAGPAACAVRPPGA